MTELADNCQDGKGFKKVHALILLLWCGFLFFAFVHSLPLADPEESRCALIVRDMINSGDWIVPHFDGEPYFDKPSPYFWLAAGSQWLTGSAEFGGRAVSAVAALLAVFIAYAAARRQWNAAAGLVAGLSLATMGEFLFLARWYRMDMPCIAAMWAAVWWFWRGEQDASVYKSRRRRWVGFYVFCAIATLFKGPVGLGLPALIVGIYFLIDGRFRRILEFFSPVGIGLYLLIAAPWYVAISLRSPGYAYEFFVHQNLLRYAGHSFQKHNVTGLVYIPLLLVGMLPWTVYLPGIFIRDFPRKWKLRNERPGLLLIWLAFFVPLLFFMLSKTTLPGYILPCFPPLAVLVGGLIGRWVQSPEKDKLLTAGAWAMTVILPLVSLGVGGFEIYLGNLDLWFIAMIVPVFLIVIGMIFACRHGGKGRFTAWMMVCVFVIYGYLLVHTVPAGYEKLSTRPLGELVRNHDEQAEFYYYAMRSESFEFYACAAGVEKIRDSKEGDFRRLAERMNSPRPVYCLVTGEERLKKLKQACGPENFHVLGRQDDLWLVGNRPRSQDGM